MRLLSIALSITGLVLVTGCASSAATPLLAPTKTPSSMPPTITSTTVIATITPSPTPSPFPSPTPFVLLPSPASISYQLPPVIQHVTETTAEIYFELQQPSSIQIFYWPVTDQSQGVALSLPEGRSMHQVLLESLQPATEYQVELVIPAGEDQYQRIPYSRETWSLTFRTWGERESIRFGVIGDSGFGEQLTYQLAQRMAEQNLDFVLHTGDVVYRMYEDPDPFTSYKLKWYLPFKPILTQMPVYPVPGNHDVEAAAQWQGQSFYYYTFPAFHDDQFESSVYEGRNQWYAFAYDHTQFLMLDTQTFINEPGRAEQNQWLAERLTDNRFAQTIVVFHVTAFTSGLHPNDGLAARQTWIPMFQNANVPLILSGHDHNYERLSIGNLTYIVSGGGSRVLYDLQEQLSQSVVFVKESHFIMIELFDDGVNLQAINNNGVIIDEVFVSTE